MFKCRKVAQDSVSLTRSVNHGSWQSNIQQSRQCVSRVSKKYSNTLNLPKTKFPLSMKDGVTASRERQLQKTASFGGLYSWQRKQDRQQEFVLHDGPPYANGEPHVGHALNKILKDIVNRYKLLRGFKIHYVPGWDCHGMPIEQKALADIRTDHFSMDPMQIRSTARKFAQKAVKSQKTAFKRWGVMANWEDCYLTYDRQFEAKQIQVFHKMYEKGLVYQDYMPVFWSPSSRSALAEAELEYNDEHVSQAVHVKFPLTHLPAELQAVVGTANKAHAVIWTTTPWTLPANRAICYGSKIKYCFAKDKKSKQIYLVAADFLDKLSQLLSTEFWVIYTFEGNALVGAKYKHPMIEEELPLLAANHVTTGKGTGLVHTAPAHGPEDFQVALKYELPNRCLVGDDGRYTDEVGSALAGKHVIDDGNQTVLDILKDSILHREDFVHSYPYDWRTKQPVILRASLQWFINTNKIKDQALASLENVDIVPKSSEHGMLAQLALRTYWCISRQRVWGVPIPVFYHSDTNSPLINKDSINHIVKLFEIHGSDCWWTMTKDQLLPENYDPESYVQGKDVLDIWFDSGSSWAAVLNEHGNQADLYLEGLDQFGGWFQSSLLTSVAINGHAPYKSVLVHGFAMDGNGRKMSKSLGNVVDPWIVTDGGKNKTTEPAYGADVLRWWAAHANQDVSVNISPAIISRFSEQVFKVRKVMRYLLGNLHDFNPAQDQLSHDRLLAQDKYMLHLLHDFGTKVSSQYENYSFGSVLQAVEKFVNTHVSGLYCHMIKDRVYCSGRDSVERISSQTVQYHLLETMMLCLAPITPHLAEEVYHHCPYTKEADSIFKTTWKQLPSEWHQPKLGALFSMVLQIRDVFYDQIGAEKSIEFDVVICPEPQLCYQLQKLQKEVTSNTSSLSEVMQASNTSILKDLPAVIPDDSQQIKASCSLLHKDGSQTEHNYVMIVLPCEKRWCDRCRRYTADTADKPCLRCQETLALKM